MKLLLLIIVFLYKGTAENKMGPFFTDVKWCKSDGETPHVSYHLQTKAVTHYDKLIFGGFKVKKTIGPLAAVFKMFKKVGDSSRYVPHRPPYRIPSLCETPFKENFHHFLKHCNATPTLLCQIEPGYYQVSNWTIHDHIAQVVGSNYAYGDYKMELAMDSGVPENPCLQMTMNVVIMSPHEKNAEKKGRKGGHKH